MDLGELIKEARTKKNLSQEELAHSLGVSRQAISKWETGIAEPHGINRELLNQLLELNLSLDGSEIKDELVNVKSKMSRYKFIMSGMFGCILILLIVIVTLTHNLNTAAKNTEGNNSNGLSDNAPHNGIAQITFYDEDTNIILDEGLWYNMEQIEYLLVSWEGEAPDSVDIYTVPTGTNMESEKELIVAKPIESEKTGTLIDLRSLKKPDLTVHLSVSLNYGDRSIVSEYYNVCYYDSDEISE